MSTFILGKGFLTTDFSFEIFKKVNNFTIINNKIVNFDKIGIYLSGGIDSLALLCLILTELKNNRLDIPIICFTVNKNDTSVHNSKVIVEKVKEHFAVDILHVTDIENDEYAIKKGNIGFSAIYKVKNYFPNMLVYMGNNRMPDKEIKTFKYPLQVDYGYTIHNPWYISPFLFLHKPHIIDLLYQLNCENLIEYAQSCTQVKVGKCNNCYACEERAWGFEMLGLTDPIS